MQWRRQFSAPPARFLPEDRPVELETSRPEGPVFRLGRRPDAWQPPDWFLAQSDGTFGNRFDDPDGYYRVLYASSQRLACFIETLARFRPELFSFHVSGSCNWSRPGHWRSPHPINSQSAPSALRGSSKDATAALCIHR